MARETLPPIGVKTYFLLTLPFDIAGFLLGAWLCRSPEAMAAFEAKLSSGGTINVVSTATPEAYREAWWLYVLLFTAAGMIVGEIVRPFIRKGPIF